jgi:hypothetical protein
MNSRIPAILFALYAWNCLAQTQTGLDSQSLGQTLEEMRAKHDVPALAAAAITDNGPELIEVVRDLCSGRRRVLENQAAAQGMSPQPMAA